MLSDVAAPPANQGVNANSSVLRVRALEPAVRVWSILATDGRLASTFERWAKADGMKLVWDAQQHIMLSSSDSYTGTLTEALNRVLTSPAIRLSPYPLEACIYPNNPPLLRITRAGEQSLECPQ
jgi:C4-dicarboxylate-specific signal transduction histidine kinase